MSNLHVSASGEFQGSVNLFISLIINVLSWGGRIVCQQLSRSGICSVGAMAHPSFMNESHVSGVASE
jgi:hypothetical protein